MQGWLKITIWIIVWLVVIAGIVYGSYRLYKYLKRKGSCHFVAYSPPSTAATSYTQAGYITCGGGGPLWKQSNLTVYNNGPGTFYLDPIPGYSGEQELDPKSKISYDPSGSAVEPSVYYVEGSSDTKPNFTITAS